MRVPALMAFLLALAGCGRINFERRSDASIGVVDASGACDPIAPFGMPMPIGELNTSDVDATLRMRPDELSGVFWGVRTNDADIVLASRNDLGSPFVETPLPAINSTAVDLDPSISPDGAFVLFSSNRAGGPGGFDVYEVIASGNTFIDPQLVSDLSSPMAENQPFIASDGVKVFLTSDRSGIQRLYRSRRLGRSSYDVPVLVAEIDSTGGEADPVLSSDALTLYWSSNGDIYRATRQTPNDPFGAQSPVSELTSTAYDGPSWVSSDNCRLYMSSARGAGDPNIYVARRTPTP